MYVYIYIYLYVYIYSFQRSCESESVFWLNELENLEIVEPFFHQTTATATSERPRGGRLPFGNQR